MNIIRKMTDWYIDNSLGSFLGREIVEATYKEVWINAPTGYNIYAHIHRPKEQGKYPAIVIVPGAGSPGTDYDKRPALTAHDIASLGFTVLHYDPSGRGKTGGEEDHWGNIHQRELAEVIKIFSDLPSVNSENIGVMSFSIGIIIASGALSKYDLPQVKYLFDWEGPSNRVNTTKNDTHKPLLNFPTSNDLFWNDREAASFIGGIKCGYFRYQAYDDHVQGYSKAHAIELLNLATTGSAKWTQCNDNPVDMLYDENRIKEYSWVPSSLDHKGQILKYLLQVQSNFFV